MSDVRVMVPLYLTDELNIFTHYSSRDGKLLKGNILQAFPGRVLTSDGMLVNEVRFTEYVYLENQIVTFKIMDKLRHSNIKLIAEVTIDLKNGDCVLIANPYYLKERLVLEIHINYNRVSDKDHLIEQGLHGHLL